MRSEFDEILLRHAEESGATVLEEHKVTEILFGPDGDSNPAGRPVSARFTCPAGEGIVHFDYLVDASGRNGMMSTKVRRSASCNFIPYSADVRLYFS